MLQKNPVRDEFHVLFPPYAAKMMEDNLTSMRKYREKDQSLTIQIDSQPDGYCGICGEG